jgi:peptidoglycan-associated lipoprotein
MIKQRRAFVLLFGFLLFFPLAILAQNNTVLKGDNAFTQYQYKKAIEYYKKAIPKLSGNLTERDRVIFRLAKIYGITDNWYMAVHYYEQLENSGYCAFDPECQNSFAKALQYTGDYDRSLFHYENYLEIVPNDSVALNMKNDLIRLRNNNKFEKYEVLNESSINSNKDDFGLVFANKKGDEVIFTSNRNGTTGKDLDQWSSAGLTDLFEAKISRSGKFNTPSLADEKGLINTPANEGTPCFTNNFSTLFYTRCDRKPETKIGDNRCVIVRANRNGSYWTIPEIILSNHENNVGHPALSDNELVMIFSCTDSVGIGGKDLWMVSRASKNESFGKPVNLGRTINTKGDEMFPSLQNDTVLYFASNGNGGYGGLDIYRTTQDSLGRWTSPINLGAPINSNADDFSIVFKRNSIEGYFSSNRDGGKGGDDIYYFKGTDLKMDLFGKISDVSAHDPLDSAFVFMINGSDTLVKLSDINGDYNFNITSVQDDNEYQIIVTHQGYFTQKQIYSSKMNDKNKHEKLDFEMIPIPETPIILPQILYELDKWDLLPQYHDSIYNLVAILDNNPNLQIELRSHTDARATDNYNDELSQKRAQTVVDFLIQEGIDPERLVAKGCGKRNPRKMEKDFRTGDFLIPKDTELNEIYITSLKKPEWREIANQLNRRTEFSVISTSFRKQVENN